MKIFLKDNLVKETNPTPEKPFSKVGVAACNEGCKDSACALLIVPSGGEVPQHHHKAREVWLFMVAGEVEGTINGESFVITTGDTVFIPAMDVHGFSNKSSHEARFIEVWTQPAIEPDFYLA